MNNAFGVYALSGAGVVRPLPLVKLGLVMIGSIYALRGLVVIRDILRLVRGDGYPLRQQDIENEPRFGQVVAGLGAPELVYHDNYVPVVREATYVGIGLDYPKQGVSVMTGRWVQGDRENVQVRLSEDQVHDMDCYVPTQSMEEILGDVYQYRSEIIDREMKRRIPWPGFGAWLP